MGTCSLATPVQAAQPAQTQHMAMLLLLLLLVASPFTPVNSQPAAADVQQTQPASGSFGAGNTALPLALGSSRNAASPDQLQCPGLTNASKCGRDCQMSICSALLRVYEATGGPAWYTNTGWVAMRQDGCDQWLSPTPSAGSAPRYCQIYGLDCCSAPDSAQAPVADPEPCPFLWAPRNLSLPNNNLAIKRRDPMLWAAMRELILCGLRRIVLQGNALPGTLPAQLPAAALMRLWTLDLSEAKLTGTLVGGRVEPSSHL